MPEKKEEMKEMAETAAVAAVAATGPQTRVVVRVVMVIILILLAALLAIWALRALTGVILLVVLAIFFAYLIAPLVDFVQRPFNVRGRKRLLPRPLAIGVVYVALFGSVGLAGYLLLPRLNDQIALFAQQAPGYLTSARERANKLNELYQAYKLPQSVRDIINRNLTHGIETASGVVGEGAKDVLFEAFGFLPWLVLIPILGFFLLKDASSFRRSALQVFPRGRWRWRADELFQDINSTLAAYIRAQLIACVLIGLICTLGFLIIGVPYALLLGIIAGLLEFIPLAGPLVVALLAALITSFYSFRQMLVVLLFLGMLRIVHDYVTYPRIIGQGIHLHPLAVILAILCGAELAGVTGIFLAIPVVAIGTVTYRHWLEHRGSTGLVADLLQPVEKTALLPPVVDLAPPTSHPERPTTKTTPEEMARLRPDLLSNELKAPKID